MSHKQKGTEWYSTPNARRKRPDIKLTLSDEAHEALVTLASERGISRSQLVEDLVLSEIRKKSARHP
jgi:hypothetical protein